ncbi:MAG: glyoxylate/hydroxypyruvate reductase A [Balneolaceae bacterium]
MVNYIAAPLRNNSYILYLYVYYFINPVHSMSILLAAPNRDMKPYRDALLKTDPNLEVEIWPDVRDKKRVQFAVAWNQPENIFGQYPNLKVISSLGAGVDHLLSDHSIPGNIELTRVVVPSLAGQMSDYVLTAALSILRNTHQYHKQQLTGNWKRLPAEKKDHFTVGVMGLGAIGKQVAADLAKSGFRVNGWAKTSKNISGVETFAKNEFSGFLKRSRIVVCLLPLTSETKDILNLDLFKQLKSPAHVINAGRGEHLVDEDLLYALDTGLLESAVLDVFKTEPLPDSHPFWGRKNIVITPHIASETNPGEVAGLLVENYKRLLSGIDLMHRVNSEKGY